MHNLSINAWILVSALTACAGPSQMTSSGGAAAATFSSADIYAAAAKSPFRKSVYAQVRAMTFEQTYQMLLNNVSETKTVVDGTSSVGGSLQHVLAAHQQFISLGRRYATVGAAWNSWHMAPDTWSYAEYKATLSHLAGANSAALSLAAAAAGAPTQGIPDVQLRSYQPGSFCDIDLTILWNLGVEVPHLLYEINTFHHTIVDQQPIFAGIAPHNGDIVLGGDKHNPSLIFYPWGHWHPQGGVQDDQGAFSKECTEPVSKDAAAAQPATAKAGATSSTSGD